jgi:cytochrome b561
LNTLNVVQALLRLGSTTRKDAMETLNRFRQIWQHKGAMATSHSWATKWVHWLAAAVLLFAVVTNGDVTGALFSPSAMQFEVYVGLTLAVVYGFLWLWTKSLGGGTRLPAQAPAWEHLLSRIVHYGLYLTITAILLTGFAMAYLAPTDLVVNAPTARILQMTTRFSIMRDAHEFFAGLLGWLFGAHFAGALWHWFVRRDGVMESIYLWRSGRKA